MSTKTYALAERIVLDTVIPTAAATVSTVSHQATAVATSASVTHCLVVSRCYVARDAGLRQVNRGRTTARNASLAARDGVSRTMSSAKAGASCALTTVRTAPARVSEAIYQAAVTTRANVNASIARAVNISKAAMDAAFARYAAVRAAVIGRYKGSRDYTVAIYSSARSRTVSTINSAASSAAERCARLHAYVAGFLSTVTERLEPFQHSFLKPRGWGTRGLLSPVLQPCLLCNHPRRTWPDDPFPQPLRPAHPGWRGLHCRQGGERCPRPPQDRQHQDLVRSPDQLHPHALRHGPRLLRVGLPPRLLRLPRILWYCRAESSLSHADHTLTLGII